jgi:hypothetical protein
MSQHNRKNHYSDKFIRSINEFDIKIIQADLSGQELKLRLSNALEMLIGLEDISDHYSA